MNHPIILWITVICSITSVVFIGLIAIGAWRSGISQNKFIANGRAWRKWMYFAYALGIIGGFFLGTIVSIKKGKNHA